MADDKKVDTEKYIGPGRFASALGDAKLYALGGSLAGAAGGGVFGALVKPDSKIAQGLESLAQEFAKGSEGWIAEKAMSRFSNGKAAVITTGAIVGSTLLALGGVIWGFANGWGKSGKAELQFNTLKAERDQAKQQAEALQTQVTGLQQEVASTHKKFTDHIQPRTGEHGSRGEAHLAAKEHAEHAGREVA